MLAADRRFIKRLKLAHGDLEDYLTGDRWYQTLGPDAPRQIAYFSPEFGIAAVLPQYSGGLGILAGDHLKTASDLGVPIIGVGLLYRHGYFRQLLSREGWQQERYPITDPDELPLRLLREDDGEVARVDVGLPVGQRLHARVWVADVGRIPLLLLDSDIEMNSAAVRETTDRLYGGEHASTGCTRRCSSASAGSGRSAPTAASPGPCRPRCSTPTRATPASSASSASGSSWRTGAWTSTPRSSRLGPAPSSRRTPPSRPGSTGSRGT